MNQNLSLEAFVDALLDEKGFSGLEPDVIAEMQNDLLQRVSDKITATIIAALPPHELETFERLLDSSPDADIQQFCATHIPDIDATTANALLEFRNQYLGR